MKKLIVLLLLPVLVIGQDFPKDIVFVKDLDLAKWNKIIARAVKEDKIIYMQYGFLENNSESLKKLKTIYNNQVILDYLNNHFICFFIPFKEFKNGYIDFSSHNFFLDSLMPVPTGGQGVPSYFFSKQGKHLHKRYPLPNNADEFLEDLQNVVNSKKNYYQMIEEFNNGNRDIEFFRNLLSTIHNSNETVDYYLKEFIKTRDNLFTKENGELIMHQYTKNVAFDYMYNNQDLWKKVISPDTLEKFYKGEISKQIAIRYYNPNIINPYDLIKLFEEKYPKYGKEESIKFLIRQLFNNDFKKPELYQSITNNIDSNIISKLTFSELNSYAWATFLNINDTTLLNKALSWSKKSLEQDKDNPMYLDTYANLLYKLGQTKEAIETETSALELVDEKEKKSYLETLDKMKQGKSTWNKQ